jgi:hypothetical protein
MRTRFALAIIAGLAAGGLAFGSETGNGSVDAVLDRWLVSQGGRARLEAVRSYGLRETIQFGPGKSLDVRALWTKLHHCRYEISGSPSNPLIQNWDGLIPWEGNDRLGYGLISAGGFFYGRNYDDLLLGLEPGRNWPKRRMVGDGEARGRPCAVLGLTGADGVEVKYYFDRVNAQCLREERPDRSVPGKWITADFSDFQETGGVSYAGTIKTVESGLTFVIRRSNLVLDPPVDEASFILSTARLKEIIAVNIILSRNLAAVGGADAISRIHSRVTRAISDSSESGLKVRETISQKEPDLILCEFDAAGLGRQWEGFDGKTGWASSEIEGFRMLMPAEVADWKTWGRLSMEGRLADHYPLRRMLGPRRVNGRAAHAVILSDVQFPAGTFYFDDENGRLLRMSTVFVESDGHEEATLDYSDFRKVDGVEKPYVTTETDTGGQSVTTITSIQDNIPLDDAMFKPRRDGW